MNSFLLRMEGVNLANVVFDTQDLSTIRGGGLKLLDAAVRVHEHIRGSHESVEALIKSASIGLFRIKSQEPPEKVRGEVEDYLARTFPHATFVVDVNETEDESPESRDLVLARNRWRQMQAPSVIYPSLENVTARTEVCEIDMVRPVAVGETNSDSVADRHKYGKKQKQEFYVGEVRLAGVNLPTIPAFVNEFDDLCGKSYQWGNLADKMAVIYLDGNKFGEISRQHCKTEKTLQDFSRGLREAQAKVLSKLLLNAIDDPDGWRNQDKQAVRLETLLWGGDEIVLVVPAWKGWETLKLFMGEFGSDAMANPVWNPAPYSLTYSAAVVFCHKKSPIRTVTKLADDLVGVVKHAGKDYQNRFVYQVLESFDHIQKVDKRFRRLVLDGEIMARVAGAMRELREFVSRKKLHRVLKSQEITDRDEAVEGIFKDLKAAESRSIRVKKARELIEELRKRAWDLLVEGWNSDEQLKKFVSELGGALQAPEGVDKFEVVSEALKAKRGSAAEDATAKEALGVVHGFKYAAWEHIAELWDYVSPLRAEA